MLCSVAKIPGKKTIQYPKRSEVEEASLGVHAQIVAQASYLKGQLKAYQKLWEGLPAVMPPQGMSFLGEYFHPDKFTRPIQIAGCSAADLEILSGYYDYQIKKVHESTHTVAKFLLLALTSLTNGEVATSKL